MSPKVVESYDHWRVVIAAAEAIRFALVPETREKVYSL